MRVSYFLPVGAFFLATRLALGFAELTPATSAAFDGYLAQAEARMQNDLQPARFLYADARPEWKTKLRDGELTIQSASAVNGGDESKIPGGTLQDWVGMMFIPGASIDEVKAVLQDYPNYKNIYQPKVTESKELARHGDEYEVFLRLYEKHVLTVVLNSTYRVRYDTLDNRRMQVTSRSTRIAEVRNAGNPEREAPIGNDTGFLWRLNSYWRFEAADGGVYAECEAISLSRDVPLGLGWMIKGFLEKFPKESMLNTLRGTRDAVKARRASTASAH